MGRVRIRHPQRPTRPRTPRRPHPRRRLCPSRSQTPRPRRRHLAQLGHQRTTQTLTHRLRPLGINHLGLHGLGLVTATLPTPRNTVTETDPDLTGAEHRLREPAGRHPVRTPEGAGTAGFHLPRQPTLERETGRVEPLDLRKPCRGPCIRHGECGIRHILRFDLPG